MSELTIELPDPIFQLLEQMTERTHQSLEALVTQSIAGNLPPSVENAPLDMQADLLDMQQRSIDELHQIAHSQISDTDQARHLTLLEKHKNNTLTSEERQELSDLRSAADRLMLRKAYAWNVLRWRGQRLPALQDLPLE